MAIAMAMTAMRLVSAPASRQYLRMLRWNWRRSIAPIMACKTSKVVVYLTASTAQPYRRESRCKRLCGLFLAEAKFITAMDYDHGDTPRFQGICSIIGLHVTDNSMSTLTQVFNKMYQRGTTSRVVRVCFSPVIGGRSTIDFIMRRMLT